jgi:nucleotide-binding universal stress UspA family protein
MKQLLFVCAGNEFPQGAFRFLQVLQQLEPVNVVGLFFSPLDLDETAVVSQVPIAAPYERLVARERATVAANKALFARKCTQHYIRYTIHANETQWDKNVLIKESRYSDVVLLCGDLFFADTHLRQPNTFLSEALHHAECPLLLVPEDFTEINQLFIGFDGSKESLFAMKQFGYLFPQLADLPTEVVYAREDASNEIPDLEHLRQYSRVHYGSLGFSKLQVKPGSPFAAWVGERRHGLLITGSYGRSSLSYLARRSFAEEVIRQQKLPVFIAHA